MNFDLKNTLKKFRTPRPGPGLNVGALATVVGFGAYSVYSSFFSVQGGYKAIKFNRFSGVQPRIYQDGTHFAMPVVEWPIIFDVRARPKPIKTLTGSRDLQMITISLRVLYRPNPNELPTIYRQLGLDYGERVLPSIGNEVLKSVVAQFDAAELLTKRPEVSREITKRLRQRARDFNLVLDDVSITHLGFGPEYAAAVEAKQVAQQDAERAKYLVQKAMQEKRSTIVRAQGEAKSAQMIGEAMQQNPGYLELKRIEAAKDIADIISQSSNKVMLNSKTLLLNIRDNKDPGTPESLSQDFGTKGSIL
eukprot:gb/GECH01004703.1/.p1 GENE.gb/GECH01004703.1/~~gb/GECH01004703.1/.p1  ORF type:complete len:306 (+),score=71.07 gb/GECH01004703.1/:1-918(+)